MIAKITRGTSVEGMVLYNHNKTTGKDKERPSAIMLGTNAMIGNRFKDIVRTIHRQNLLNSNITKPNIHISLNFHNNDILANNAVYDIAYRYMQEMGFEEQPFAVYRHFDTSHPHVHIVSSQIDYEGKFIDDSHIFRRSQRISRNLEIEFGITKAVGHNTELNTNKIEKAIQDYLEEGRGPLVPLLRKIVEEVMQLRPVSFKEFDFLLKGYQVIRENMGNDIDGHVFKLLPMDQLELERRHSGHKGIKGVEIGNDFSYQAISKSIEMNHEGKRSINRNIQGRVFAIINSINSPTALSIFNTELKKKGVSLAVNRSQTGVNAGQIYGMIFSDIKTGYRYTATELKVKTKNLLELIIDDKSDLIDNVKGQSTKDMKAIPLDDADIGDIDFGKPVEMEVDFGNVLDTFSSLFASHYTHNEENDLLKKRKKKRRKRN